MYDVVIVGAGPAGGRMAFRMAEAGFSTIVLDKKKDLADPVCCTGIVGRECIETYRIDNRVIYREASGASIFSPSGKPLYIRRPDPQAAILDRPAFNEYLARPAIALGAEYRLETQVTDIRRTADRVIVETANDAVEARTLVIANGFGSKLPGMIGLDTVPDFAMGVQAEVETDTLEEVEVFLGRDIAPGFFAWLVPTGPGRGLAGLMSRRDTGAYMKKFLSFLAEQGKIKDADPEISFAGVALKPVRRAAADRVLVVGSAAGQVKPITGGGVYYGMLCADIAADTLASAFQSDDLTIKALSAYDRRWKLLLGRETNLSYQARRFYERLSDRSIEKILDITQSSQLDKRLLESTDLRFDWHSAVILKLLTPRMIARMIGKSLSSWKQG